MRSSDGTVKEHDGRTCGLEDVGPAAPVMLLAWLLLAMPLCTVGLMDNVVLMIIATGLSGILSVVLSISSLNLGWRWITFSIFCFLSSLVGLALGVYLQGFEDDVLKPGSPRVNLCMVILVGSLLAYLAASLFMNVLGCGLVGSSAIFAEAEGWEWNAAAVANMHYGFDWKHVSGAELVGMHVHPRWVALGLLNHHCCWSGEPAVDYMFYIANEHTFLGCLLCHPVHPYEKHERTMVLLIQCSLCVFPVAFFFVAFQNPLVRTILLLLIVTVPRNVLKSSLKRIVLSEDEVQLGIDDVDETTSLLETRDGGDMKVKRRDLRAADAWWKAFCFFAVCVVFTACVASCCVAYIRPRQPLGATLWEASHGMAFAFLLELLFELVLPRWCEGTCVIGFFGQWRHQRLKYTRNWPQKSAKAPLRTWKAA